MSNPLAAVGDTGLDRELAQLEGRLATLLAHARELRAANDGLRRDLAAAQDKNRSLNERVLAAAERLDALLARLPDAAR